MNEKLVEAVRYCWEVIQGQCSDGDGFTERAAYDLDAAISTLEAAKGGGEAVADLVSRADVIRTLRELGEQDADLALYGAADNARAREYGEAAATRACCAVALIPAASPTAPALPQDVVRLVIAARDVAYSDPTPETMQELDKASEAFAERVPWEDEPDHEEDGPSTPAAGEVNPVAFGWFEPIKPEPSGSLIERFRKGAERPFNWSRHAFPVYASTPSALSAEIELAALRKSYAALETLWREAAKTAPALNVAVEALTDAEDTLRLVEQPAFEDPVYGAEVAALGERIGFGALMSSASASWRKMLQGRGGLAGGEFVSGPCHVTVVSTLRKLREALATIRLDEAPTPADAVKTVAAFLRDRDEAGLTADAMGDEEREESARCILALLQATPHD